MFLLSRWPLGRLRPGHRVSSCPPARPSQKVDSTALPDCLGLPDPQLSAKGGKSARKWKLNCGVFIIKLMYVTMSFCSTEQGRSGMDISVPLCPFFLSLFLSLPPSAFLPVFACLPPVASLLYLTSLLPCAAACSCCASERCQGGCGDPQMVRVVPAQRELGQVPLSD